MPCTLDTPDAAAGALSGGRAGDGWESDARRGDDHERRGRRAEVAPPPEDAVAGMRAPAGDPDMTAGKEDLVRPAELTVPKEMTWPRTQRQFDVLERTAKFLAPLDTQMEILLRTKQGTNPWMHFLEPSHRLNPFYRHVKRLIAAGDYSPRARNASTSTASEQDTGGEGQVKPTQHDAGGKEDVGTRDGLLVRARSSRALVAYDSDEEGSDESACDRDTGVAEDALSKAAGMAAMGTSTADRSTPSPVSIQPESHVDVQAENKQEARGGSGVDTTEDACTGEATEGTARSTASIEDVGEGAASGPLSIENAGEGAASGPALIGDVDEGDASGTAPIGDAAEGAARSTASATSHSLFLSQPDVAGDGRLEVDLDHATIATPPSDGRAGEGDRPSSADEGEIINCKGTDTNPATSDEAKSRLCTADGPPVDKAAELDNPESVLGGGEHTSAPPGAPPSPPPPTAPQAHCATPPVPTPPVPPASLGVPPPPPAQSAASAALPSLQGTGPVPPQTAFGSAWSHHYSALPTWRGRAPRNAVVIPPPDIKSIVDKIAQYVARNGKVGYDTAGGWTCVAPVPFTCLR